LQDCRIAESKGQEGEKGQKAERAARLDWNAACSRRCVDRTAEDLKTRTKAYAVVILEFVDTLPRTPAAETIARQLARAGAGLVGNYRSACRARSHTEFTARMGIAVDESDESELWITVADERQWGDTSRRAWLLKESGELRAIFSKAYQTAKSNERR
jgi:four helix bundle protein